MIIVLTGIDGSGKSTAANALVSGVQARGGRALLLKNHAGRRSMAVLSARLGIRLPNRLADGIETVFRVWNVLVSSVRAGSADGLVVMDRHLYCQLALREGKGLPRGRFLPWLLATLPRPDAVVHLEVAPEEARRRILARGTDSETLADLTALRDGYHRLPGYGSFLKVDASLPAPEVLRQLAELTGAVQRESVTARR